jgi:hypothetical protein
MPTASTAAQKYLRTPTGFVMVQHPDDDVLPELEQLAIQEKIGGPSFTGFGLGHLTWWYRRPGSGSVHRRRQPGPASLSRAANSPIAGHPAANGWR